MHVVGYVAAIVGLMVVLSWLRKLWLARAGPGAPPHPEPPPAAAPAPAADPDSRAAAVECAPEMPRRQAQIEAARQQQIRTAIEKARALVEQGHFDAALATVETVLKTDPGNADAQGLRSSIEAQREMRARTPDLTRAGGVTGLPAEVPASVALDNVHFSITAPAACAPASNFELLFWAHLESQREAVLERAQLALGVPLLREMFLKSEGPFPLARGSQLSVRVRIDGLEVKPVNKPLLWMGEIGCAGFVVSVPPGAAEGGHIGVASIRLNGSQIARMDFVLKVGPAAQPAVPIPATVALHKTAFASYASEDRDQVIARVQGMQAALPSLKVFVDVVDLRSGQYWEQELWKRIPQSDVLYLFWCRHARGSPWVEKEWRCALQARGLDFIDPVPLEPPQLAPPPPELAARHFYDPLLAFGGSHAAAATP